MLQCEDRKKGKKKIARFEFPIVKLLNSVYKMRTIFQLNTFKKTKITLNNKSIYTRLQLVGR